MSPHDYPAAMTFSLADHPDEGDPLQLIVPMRKKLGGLVTTGISSEHGAQFVHSLAPVLQAVSDELLTHLRNATLPVSQPLRILSAATEQLYENCAQIVPQEEYLFQQMLIAQLSGLRLKPGFWSKAWYLARQSVGVSGQSPVFGSMLALAAVQPESLAPPELIFLAKLIQGHGDKIQIQQQRPNQESNWYWLDCSQNLAPSALRRRQSPAGPEVLYFNCGEVGRHFSTLLGHLETGVPASQLDIIPEGSQSVCINALRRALTHWTAPPTRGIPRRKGSTRVQVCVRLGELWTALRSEHVSVDNYSDWLVINENPNGYALMHLAGPVGGVVPGSVLGLRVSPAEPWSICLVRWVRTENPENVELGLELMAPQARAVRVAAANSTTPPVAALLLSALPRSGPREALLISQGQYSRGRFTLITESDQRVKLTACQPGELRHRTSSVEIFEFERQPLA